MIAGIPLARLLQWLGVVSAVMFLVSILLVPWLILRLDHDFFLYFCGRQRSQVQRHPVTGMMVFVLRNIVGVILVAAGITMLVLPGQGILTLLTGLSIMQFPGKHWVLAKVVSNTKVQNGLNWIRAKGGKSLFVFTACQQSEGVRHD
jgi:hypothetical protein